MSEFNKPTNPPAFPKSDIALDSGQVLYRESGMTLRDYFAAKAMHGTLFHIEKVLKQDEMQGLANMSYRMADAMLKAREA